jgi:hypothetical protein
MYDNCRHDGAEVVVYQPNEEEAINQSYRVPGAPGDGLL